ncbi:MAG: ESX secretion-associated protein EspG [Nocardia sp.]|nr:ESX secretion-associated protein EspG [Nocardia sp.]
MIRWTFTALSFTVLWRAAGHDILPYPLQFRSRAETTADFDAEWKAAAGELADRVDDNLEAAIRVLHTPEVRVEMSGFAGAPKDSGDLLQMGSPQHRVRTHASASLGRAVLLTQEPTTDPESGGPVHMSLLATDNLATHLFAGLPQCRPGTSTTQRYNHRDLTDEDRPFTAFTDTATRPPRERATRFFNRPRTTIVYIATCPGPAWDRRPTPARDFHIVDYPDGRYLLRNNNTELRADPTDIPTLESHLTRLVDITTEGFREDHNPHYT